MPSHTRIIAIVVAVVASLGAGAFLVFSAIQAANGTTTPLTVDEIVQSLHDTTDFPQRVDHLTTFDDVTAEPSAIHYFYTMDMGEGSSVTETEIRESVMQGLCAQEATKALLDSGVDLNYTYTMKGMNAVWDFGFTKGYCP